VLLPSTAFVRAARRLNRRDPDLADDLRIVLELLAENALDPRLKSHKLKDYTDTPLHGMPCLIRLKKRRQRCKDCKHVCACAPNQHFDEDFRMTVRCAQ
jgi:hypothetical protein